MEVNPDVLAIALLYSLPPSFGNFRVAIESRDDLPDLDALRIKIIEEFDARRSERTSTAMYMKGKPVQQKNPSAKVDNSGNYSVQSKTKKSRIRCNKCKLFGHRAAQCRNKNANPCNTSANAVENVSLCASEALIVRSVRCARK